MRNFHVFHYFHCGSQVSGPTVQEYDAPNVVMRDYLCCAARELGVEKFA